MATAQKIVAVDRPSGSYSLMYGPIRIDVSKKPLFDSVDKTRPDRHNYCEKHKSQLRSAFYCEEGDHYLRNGESMKGVDVDGIIVEFTDDEVKSLKQDRDGVVELSAMLDWLDPIYFENAWIVWPKDVTWAKPFKLLQETMSAYDSMILGVVIEEGTPRVLALRVAEIDGCDVMVAHLCHHELCLRAEMVHTIGNAVAKLEMPSPKELKLADAAFHSLPTEMPLDNVKDEYGEAQRKYLEAKVSKKKYVRPELKTKEATFSQMMAELEKEVAKAKSKPTTKAKKGAKVKA